MLPAHLKLSSSARASQEKEFIPTHPLGITGVICRSYTIRRNARPLHYTLYRPRHVKLGPPPLIGIAGGPGLPCQYLSALVHTIEDRAVILYDQAGCGQSIYKEQDAFDLQEMVLDLAYLLKSLECEQFHLLGHSFGGLIAYEYILQNADSPCLSVILSNTPCSIPKAQQRVQQLQEQLRETEDDPIGAFFHRHECLVHPLPLPLQQSLDSAGFSSSAQSRGFSGILKDYEAKQEVSNIPAILLQGQHDFVNDVCDWQDLFSSGRTEYIMLAGCSHYVMLENESLFGSVVSSFLTRNEPPPKPLVLPRPPDS